jgi:high-affinity iron transporter
LGNPVFQPVLGRFYKSFCTALLVTLLSLHTISAQASSQGFGGSDSASRTLVHLLDYLARDYSGAVQDGKILSESEYAEQVEFAQKLIKLHTQVQYAASAKASEVSEIHRKIEGLNRLVREKAAAEKVAESARAIRADVIRLSGMVTTPAAAPDIAQGQKLYAQRCASCHGAQGFGDGVAAANLQPKPINFHDPKVMETLSPLQAFNAIRLGVDGTAMAPQSDLSDQDTWNIAYFALTFASGSNGGDSDGSAGGGGASDRTLAIGRSRLTQAGAEYRAGHLVEAQDHALAAYLEGFEPVEPKLKANDPAFVSKIETLMMRVRQAIEGREAVAAVDTAVANALDGLQDVEGKMARTEMSPAMSFTAAAAVLLREGFEAVLVILAFLGVVRTSGNRKAEKWLHGGWIAAIVLGFVAWFFSGWLIGISGAQREAMEAITAFFAAAVLLFVGFWLHQKTEITRWKAFVETQVKTALEQKSLFGLAMISFIAVFRETLETVLFLRAIWVDCGPAAKNGLALGVAVSFVSTMTLAWLALRFSRRLPIRQLFTLSSSVMAALAVMLIGKGIHSLQETGTLSITAAPLKLHSELFGVFPTWETLVSQILILSLIAFLWGQGRRRPATSSSPANPAQA